MFKSVEICNIRCSGCVATITKALKKEGFDSVDVDLSCEPRIVTLELQNEASLAQIRILLRKLGYPFCDEELSFSDSTTLKAKSFVSCAVGKFSIKDDAI